MVNNKIGVCGQKKGMAISGIKRHHVLLNGAKVILTEDTDKTEEKWISGPKLLNFTSYNELILSQEDTVCFLILEEARKNRIITETQD